MGIQLMNIQRQHEEHAEAIEAAALRALRSGMYIGGEEVKLFEQEFADYLGAEHCISCGNGTDALVIALRALGIGAGDEVITVAFTFFATAESIAAVGAKPVFVEIDPATYCMDPDCIEAVITKKTKAILPVHFYGHAADMDRICAIAKKHNLLVIEDCAQAAGTLYKGKPVGTFGDVGCFSFFPTKNLGCDGDGGLIATNDECVARAARSLKLHGSGMDGRWALEREYAGRGAALPADLPMGTTKYYNYLIGYNSRLDAVQAAILRVKLPLLEGFVERRRNNAVLYNAALKNTGYRTPSEQEYTRHSYYVYVLQHDDAQRIMPALKEKGIPCGTYYPVPLHLQGAFVDLGYRRGDLPITEKMSDTTFAIPVYPELYDAERDAVVKALLEEDHGK